MARFTFTYISASPGAHAGISLQIAAFCSARNDSGTQVNETGVEVTARQPASISAKLIRVAGPVALKSPITPFSASLTIHSVRSRWSMTCDEWLGFPGARTSPPSSTRTGQYVKRSVGSVGPTMSPGRTMVARFGNAACTRFSEIAFVRPYGASSPSLNPGGGAKRSYDSSIGSVRTFPAVA
jgi:hypothetical protein